MLGGRKLAAPLARRSGAFQMAIGAIMVLVAFAMWQGYDTKFQSNVIAELPSFLTNPAEGIEKSHSAQVALAEIRGGNGHGIGTEGAGSRLRRIVEQARALRRRRRTRARASKARAKRS